ncbi:hypothetical protein Q3G72_008680 [Acer saccharum]|nr:hypothetical protein Q3G72_008680 [Acer saccharum]
MLVNVKELQYDAWLRDASPSKQIGNHDWSLRYNSRGYRRPSHVMEEARRHNSGDRSLEGREISGRGIDIIETSKEGRNVEVEAGSLNSNGGGSDPKPIFIFGSCGVTKTSNRLGDYAGSQTVKSTSVVSSGLKPLVYGLLDVEKTGKNEVDLTIATIGPTMTDDKVRKKSGINGRKVGQWKKAVRRSLMIERVLVPKLSYGKRKEVVTIDCFFDRTKKPKNESSKLGSEFLSTGQMPLARCTQ